MTKEQLKEQIEDLRTELNSRINSRQDLPKCQALSEQLDDLIAQYQEM